jgi:hypothetical protein
MMYSINLILIKMDLLHLSNGIEILMIFYQWINSRNNFYLNIWMSLNYK